MSMTGDGVRWTDIDGVRTVWGAAPGPLAASLVFRVGTADETLTTHGTTHMVEHLALYPLGQQPHYQNGSVRTTVTSFDTSGEPAEVAAFLRGVCENLSALELGRLPDELRVLETEEERRGWGSVSALLAWRFGPNGPGLWAYDQHARRTMDGEHLQLWADSVFTRGNAVLVLTGPPPEDLALPLRDGARRATPQLVDVLPSFPAWFQSPTTDVTVHSLLTRSVAAAACSHALSRELVDSLRYRLGVAYSPTVDYDPYDGTTAQLLVGTDAHKDHCAAVLSALLDTVDRLADRGPEQAHLDEYRSQWARTRTLPGSDAGEAHRQALELLFTGAVTAPEQLEQELLGTTVDDVAAAATELRARALYALPEGVEPPRPTITKAPESSAAPPVAGYVHRYIGRAAEAADATLVLADTGLTLNPPEGEPVTVMFADCRAALLYPDGARRLHAYDGVTITVEPVLWENGHHLVARLDAATAGVRVPMPPRDPSLIPEQMTAEPTGAAPLTRGSRIMRVIAGSAAAALAITSVTSTIVSGGRPGVGPALVGMLAGWLLVSGLKG